LPNAGLRRLTILPDQRNRRPIDREPTKDGPDAKVALLDAAERLLVRDGYARITTRRLATESGVNQGLIHYYFGSMENLLVSVAERIGEAVLGRQRAIYESDAPFLEKWRADVRGFLEQDISRGFPKVWFELIGLASNKPDFRKRMRNLLKQMRDLMTTSLMEELGHSDPAAESGPSVEALGALFSTIIQGMLSERLVGVSRGHTELIQFIDSELERLLPTPPE
jgi:AcrR family transcriptional regulator